MLQAIIEDVSRGMEDMFIEILKCERDQGETANVQEAKEDAKRLYKVCFDLRVVSLALELR